jgi:hypothetical protein
MYCKLTNNEMKNHQVGEPITLTALMTVVCSAIVAVIVYKLFISQKGSTTIPGGWKFTWN